MCVSVPATDASDRMDAGDVEGAARVHPPRQAEVEHLDLSVGGERDVRRLQVAMDDTPPMRVVQRRGDLYTPPDDVPGRRRRASDDLAQRVALDELEHDERQPVDVLHFVHAADVGVPELRCVLRLLQQPPSGLRVARIAHQLDRDGPVEPGVASPVHLADAPRPQELDDLVAPQHGPGGEARSERPGRGCRRGGRPPAPR